MKQQKPMPVALPAYILVSGPQNSPLMLEQSGIRHATLFSSEKQVARFQQACCSVDAYRIQILETFAEVADNAG